jgi:hypothetical protein
MLKRRLQLKRALKKELIQKQDVFLSLKSRMDFLAKFESAIDTAKKVDHSLTLKLIGLYRELHKDKTTVSEQKVISGILLLYFWGDMQFLRNDKEIRAKLFRIGEPFAEIYFAYMLLVAEGDFNRLLAYGKSIREIFYENAREFIKEEYRRQCVYEI